MHNAEHGCLFGEMANVPRALRVHTVDSLLLWTTIASVMTGLCLLPPTVPSAVSTSSSSSVDGDCGEHVAKKRGPDTFISRLFTRHRDLRKIEGRRAREMARTMKDVKKKALGLIERNMTTFREAGAYIDSASAVSRAQQTVAEIDALMAQRTDWATSNVLSMRQEAWTQGVSDIQFASQRLPGNIQASMAGSFGQVFPEAGFSAIEHPVLGVAPDAMFNGVRAGTTQNMRDVLVNAVVSGESVQTTGRLLSDAMDLSVAAGERIARTNVNAMYNEAHRAVYDANSDIIAGYAWEATLDDRTSQVCFMLHGQFWPLGSKTPGPPAHWNCRSILIPVFKDPAIQSLLDETPRRARQYDKRGRMRDTMVKSSTTPEQWARRQPTEITRKITGSKLKNSLFRRKLIGFDDLVDPSLRVRTDQEIIRRAAGLHPGNAALQKQARAMGVKRIPSQQAIRKADASLARKQPWKAPEPTPLQKKAAEAPVPPKKPPPSLKTEVTPVKKSYRSRASDPDYQKAYKEWDKSLSAEEREVFLDWKQDHREFVKRIRLREIGVVKSPDPMGMNVKQSMEALHSALARAPNRGGTVSRGLSLSDHELKQLLQLESIPIDATASATRSEFFARSFAHIQTGHGRPNRVVLRLKTSSSVDIDPLLIKLGEETELEHLLRRGTNFRITKVEKVMHLGKEYTYIFGEEI